LECLDQFRARGIWQERKVQKKRRKAPDWIGQHVVEKKKGIRTYWSLLRFGAVCTWLFLEISERKRDNVSRSKGVADSVHLDPWRTGICPVCFG
jgi:hypothetical protein